MAADDLLHDVQDRIAKASRIAGRKPAETTLIAVSKTHGADAILPLLEAGHRVFGENRVQEAAEKWPALRERYPDVELHLIGQLQSNKAVEAVALFDAIHSVDRSSLIAALAKAMEDGERPACFVQVNIGDEPQKGGCAIGDVPALLAEARDAGLPIVGLMAIPPADIEPAPYFALLAKIAREHGLAQISMGMSADYETAVTLGATHVRVGSALFGARGCGMSGFTPDALIFDFDGVLIESEYEGNAQIARYLTGIGHPTSPEDSMAKFMGLSGRGFIDAIERHIGRPLPEDFHTVRAAEDARVMAEGVGAVAGAIRFVRGLPRDLPRAIASSSRTPWIVRHLDHIGLRDAFGTMIFSGREHVEHGKPAPDLYLYAAKAMGVPIERCAILEDSPVGATGAVASGAYVIGLCAGTHCGVDHDKRLKAIGVDAIADDFAQVAALLNLPAA